jgi:phosphoglycerate kinase
MKYLRSVEEINQDTNVILRIDSDLPLDEGRVLDDSRLKKSIPTIRYLLEKNCKIVIIGHLGRPNGFDEKLSLRPIYLELMQLLEIEGQDTLASVFVDDIKNQEKISMAIQNNQIIFFENIRFWEEEEKGETLLFEGLKKYVSVYVNDAFAVAHRKSASIIIHREMETYYGLSFVEEVENIKIILARRERPLTVILGGAKEDKLKYINELAEIVDYVLIGGKLPKFIMSNYQFLMFNEKIKIAKLREDGLDLSNEDIENFIEIINSSKTLIWTGAMGFYESDNSRNGTEKIAQAVANTGAKKIIAGGDTGASIKNLGLKDKIDFICSGGGVMLEMLVKEDLPAWD